MSGVEFDQVYLSFLLYTSYVHVSFPKFDFWRFRFKRKHKMKNATVFEFFWHFYCFGYFCFCGELRWIHVFQERVGFPVGGWMGRWVGGWMGEWVEVDMTLCNFEWYFQKYCWKGNIANVMLFMFRKLPMPCENFFFCLKTWSPCEASIGSKSVAFVCAARHEWKLLLEECLARFPTHLLREVRRGPCLRNVRLRKGDEWLEHNFPSPEFL